MRRGASASENRFSRRAFLTQVFGGGVALGVLSACGPSAPQSPQNAGPAPTAVEKLNAPQSISTAGAASTAAAQPTAAPAAASTQPKGPKATWMASVSAATTSANAILLRLSTTGRVNQREITPDPFMLKIRGSIPFPDS